MNRRNFLKMTALASATAAASRMAYGQSAVDPESAAQAPDSV
ncbi:MAG: twin-arginine translocation signal domain-containing protein, partial [Persicimonas sp.]